MPKLVLTWQEKRTFVYEFVPGDDRYFQRWPFEEMVRQSALNVMVGIDPESVRFRWSAYEGGFTLSYLMHCQYSQHFTYDDANPAMTGELVVRAINNAGFDKRPGVIVETVASRFEWDD